MEHHPTRKKKRWGRKILIGLFAAFILIQFYRPPKNLGEVMPAAGGLIHAVAVPDSVQAVLVTACYDCHSNRTRYPWYAEISPVSVFLANHVREGKKELNFSEFGSLSPRRMRSKLSAITEQVEEKEMPPRSYVWIHRDADLSEEQRRLLIAWTDSTRRFLEDRK
ncbi:heme-binding domain-containing protein [Flaviaesturariibacter amylovorans]|uniref:Haem-binding domain-containing protein n=1 Tax=Flaviaesturariibacter amylovorans TaxID=1084520 RepID=A0ABP8HL36_9BACT